MAAADELGVTASALSYQIRQLETALGMKLFNRLNRAVELTSAGELLAPAVIEAFDNLERGFAQLNPDTDDRTLVVSTGPAFSAKWLAPRLHWFLEDYPDLDFRLSASLKIVDFIADGVHAAIRFGRTDYPDLYVEPLFDEVSLPLIAPSLFEQAGGKADESLFGRVSLLHDDSIAAMSGDVWQQWLRAANYISVDASRGSRFSHADHCIEAAVDGAGIAMGRLALAFRDIEAGRLIAPFDLAVRPHGAFSFCCPKSALDIPRVLNFLAWLRDEADEQAKKSAAFLEPIRIVNAT